MACDDHLGGPSAYSTTAETPGPRRESRGLGRWRKVVRVSWVTGSRPSRAAARSVLTCTPISSASTESGRSCGRPDASPAHARVRALRRRCSPARHPTSGTIRGTHRAGRRMPPATGPTRSGTHAACEAPRRHTMPSAPAAGKCGIGAGRTSVSQSWKVTGHFFRLHLRLWCPGVGTISEFFRKMARPAGFEPATLGLEGPMSDR